MFHEFALDPEVLRTWPAFRFLTEQFGISQGRMIAQFPKKWKRAVYDACAGTSPIDRSRIEERLRSIDMKLYHSGRVFDGNLDWIENAVTSHAGKSFRAIITLAERCNVPGTWDHELITADDDRWSPGIPPVLRQASAMAEAATMLLKSSAEIVFVDQHYSCQARHGRPLARFLELALQGAGVKRLEYHLGCHGSSDWFLESLQKQVRYFQLPANVRLSFFRWRERPSGEELHPRYILTELGGIRFEVGLDECNDPDGIQTTDVSALDHVTYKQRWSEYRRNSPVFDLADAWEVVNGRVSRM